MSTHDAPVTSRNRIPRKQSRSGTRGRWQPSGCVRGGGGIKGSIAAQMASTTSGSRARMMTSVLHQVIGRGKHPV
jgi:hypothetical protein